MTRSSGQITAADVPDGEADVAIRLDDVSFGYRNSHTILKNVSLDVPKGEIVTVIGPSGCGKSTILNLIAGSVTPTSGQVSCSGTAVHGLNRKVTYMTQKDTLLPWRTAINNAALPLEIRGVDRAERHERAREVLDLVGVAKFENKRPHELSGGMRARLSLARALLSDSDILLLDEPFAAIDALLRLRLQQLLLTVWTKTNRTMIYVTHDLNEAIALGHRVIVMGTDPGRVVRETRIDVEQPREVAQFRTTPLAQSLYVELWDALEGQLRRDPSVK